MKFVQKHLNITIYGKILWTDSQCVLHWIETKKTLSIFVENRLKEIRSQIDIFFKYVSSKENPADVAIRGISVAMLKEHKVW